MLLHNRALFPFNDSHSRHFSKFHDYTLLFIDVMKRVFRDGNLDFTGFSLKDVTEEYKEREDHDVPSSEHFLNGFAFGLCYELSVPASGQGANEPKVNMKTLQERAVDEMFTPVKIPNSNRCTLKRRPGAFECASSDLIADFLRLSTAVSNKSFTHYRQSLEAVEGEVKKCRKWGEDFKVDVVNAFAAVFLGRDVQLTFDFLMEPAVALCTGVFMYGKFAESFDQSEHALDERVREKMAETLGDAEMEGMLTFLSKLYKEGGAEEVPMTVTADEIKRARATQSVLLDLMPSFTGWKSDLSKDEIAKRKKLEELVCGRTKTFHIWEFEWSSMSKRKHCTDYLFIEHVEHMKRHPKKVLREGLFDGLITGIPNLDSPYDLVSDINVGGRAMNASLDQSDIEVGDGATNTSFNDDEDHSFGPEPPDDNEDDAFGQEDSHHEEDHEEDHNKGGTTPKQHESKGGSPSNAITGALRNLSINNRGQQKKKAPKPASGVTRASESLETRNPKKRCARDPPVAQDRPGDYTGVLTSSKFISEKLGGRLPQGLFHEKEAKRRQTLMDHMEMVPPSNGGRPLTKAGGGRPKPPAPVDVCKQHPHAFTKILQCPHCALWMEMKFTPRFQQRRDFEDERKKLKFVFETKTQMDGSGRRIKYEQVRHDRLYKNNDLMHNRHVSNYIRMKEHIRKHHCEPAFRDLCVATIEGNEAYAHEEKEKLKELVKGTPDASDPTATWLPYEFLSEALPSLYHDQKIRAVAYHDRNVRGAAFTDGATTEAASPAASLKQAKSEGGTNRSRKVPKAFGVI